MIKDRLLREKMAENLNELERKTNGLKDELENERPGDPELIADIHYLKSKAKVIRNDLCA